MQRVTTRRSVVVDRYRAVARGDAIGLLLDGPHLVREALDADLRVRSAVVTSESVDRVEVRDIVRALERRGVEVLSAPPAVMAAASPVKSPSGIVALADPRPLDVDAPYGRRSPLVVIACGVQDPGNLGAMVRVAEAGGATGLVTTGQSADPFGWKALRGSMGSALRIPIAKHASIADAMDQARRHGCRVVATTPRDGRSLFEADLRNPVVVLVGGEGSGLPAGVLAAADERISIPMDPPVESLNAATTVALMVYEARRQRR